MRPLNSVSRYTLFCLFILQLSCQKEFDPPSPGTGTGNGNPTPVLATVTTSTPLAVNSVTVKAGGVVTDSGHVPVTERGICYSTTVNPTISNNRIAKGSGLGSFDTTINGLTAGTTYYIRAYAINSVGVAYGNQQSILTPNTPPPVPVDSASLLFIGARNSLICFDARNGNALWSRAVGTGWLLFTPNYSDGMVYEVSNESTLYAFDTTGVLKWSAYMGPNTHMHCGPLIYNDKVLIASNDTIFAFNKTTGALQWHLRPGISFYEGASMTLANNVLYANFDGITAINPNNGSIIWTSTTIQNRFITPKVDGNRLYTVFDFSLNISDAATGTLLATSPYTGTSNPLAVNVAYGNVYLFKEDGLKVFDKITCAFKWSLSASALPYAFLGGGASPVIRDSILHLHTGDKIYMYNAITGAHIADYGGKMSGAGVTVVNDMAFFGMRDTYNPYTTPMMGVEFKGDGTVYGPGTWQSTLLADFTTTPCVVTKSGKVFRAGDSN